MHEFAVFFHFIAHFVTVLTASPLSS